MDDRCRDVVNGVVVLVVVVDVVVVDSVVVVLDAVVESDFEKYLTMNYDR